MPELSGSNYSEVDASNTNAAPNGFPEGMAFSGVNDSARALIGAVMRAFNRLTGRYASTGSDPNYQVSPTQALAAYVIGERHSFRASFMNVGQATLNVSGLGAKIIKKMTSSGKSDLAAGDIQSGQPVTVEYDGTDMILVTPPSTSIAQASGSWTPTLSGASTAGTQTYSPQVGRYLRQGDLVTAWFTITLTAKGTMSGNAIITGLPFTSSDVTSLFGAVTLNYWGDATLAAGYTSVGAFVDQNSATIRLYKSGSGQPIAPVDSSEIGNSAVFSGVAVYRIN